MVALILKVLQSAGLKSPAFNNGMHPTANSVAFMRETTSLFR
jgi:hypothetical protein